MSVRRYSLNFSPRPAPRGRDGKELIQCPTSSCDGMGHVSGNYATHRRQGSISTFTPRLWRERSIMYISIWRCSTHVRTLHTHLHAYMHTYMPYITYSLLATHATSRTHTYTYLFLNLCWPSFWSSPTKLPVVIFITFESAEEWRYVLRWLLHVHTRWHQVNLRVTFTWMVSLASMHIGGPWRSCFLSVLRYETYV